MFAIKFIASKPNKTSNHTALYTTAFAASVPKSFSMNVAVPMDAAKTKSRIPIVVMEKNKLDIFFI